MDTFEDFAAADGFTRGWFPVDAAHPWQPFDGFGRPIPPGIREESDAEFRARILRGDAETPRATPTMPEDFLAALPEQHGVELSEMLPISYKPGWSFSWSQANGMIFLTIDVSAPSEKGTCSRCGGARPGPCWMFTPPLPFRTEWLVAKLEELEAHERAEWLTINGVRVLDPHPETSNRASSEPKGHMKTPDGRCSECEGLLAGPPMAPTGA